MSAVVTENAPSEIQNYHRESSVEYIKFPKELLMGSAMSTTLGNYDKIEKIGEGTFG